MKLLPIFVMLIFFAGFASAFNWSDGTVDAYWDFNEGTGTTLADRTGNLPDAVLVSSNDSAWVGGRIRNGLFFYGIADYLNTTFRKNYTLSDDFTFNYWYNTNNSETNAREHMGTIGADLSTIGLDYTSSMAIRYKVKSGSDSASQPITTTPINTSFWVMQTLVRNTTSDRILLYVNGTLQANVTDISTKVISFLDKAITLGARNQGGGPTAFTDGSIDEMGIWSRVLSTSEISELYNNGAGLAFEGENITTRLDAPENASTPTGIVNFSVKLRSFGDFNLTNATLIVWNANLTVFNETTININGTSKFQNFSLNNFNVEGYIWNVVACANSSTFSNCAYAAENFTFDWIPYQIIDEIFKNETSEGNVDRFSLEVLVEDGFQPIEANLIWNGTVNQGTIISLGGGSFNFTRDMFIPTLSADENISFFWQLIFDTDDEFQSNTTAQNQSVLNLNIDDCSVFSLLILNFSLFEEESQAILNGTIEISLELRSSDNSESILNFSQAYVNVTSAAVCLNSGALDASSFLIDTTTGYTAPNFAEEFHNIQSGILSTATAAINISLFDLLLADSTTFSLTYKGLDFLPIPGALFNIQRKYISEGVFKSVEIVEADALGAAKAHFDVEGVIYSISITVSGVLIDSFNNVKVLCDNAVTGDCAINLNSFSSNTDFTDWETIGGVSYNMVFDEDARTIVTTFTVVDGTTKLITLNGTEFGAAGLPLCSVSLLSSAGTLTCNIPSSFGNGTILAQLFVGELSVTTRLYKISPSVEDTFGVDAFVFAFILIATFPLMMISSNIGIIFGLILGILASFMLLLIDNQGLLGPTSAFIWLLIAGGILVYKLFRRDS